MNNLEICLKQDAQLRATCLIYGNDSPQADNIRNNVMDDRAYCELSSEEQSLLTESQCEWSNTEDRLLVLACAIFSDDSRFNEADDALAKEAVVLASKLKALIAQSGVGTIGT